MLSQEKKIARFAFPCTYYYFSQKASNEITTFLKKICDCDWSQSHCIIFTHLFKKWSMQMPFALLFFMSRCSFMSAVIEIIRDRKFIKHGRGERKKKQSKYLKYFRPALKNGFRSEIGGDKLFRNFFLKKENVAGSDWSNLDAFQWTI